MITKKIISIIVSYFSLVNSKESQGIERIWKDLKLLKRIHLELTITNNNGLRLGISAQLPCIISRNRRARGREELGMATLHDVDADDLGGNSCRSRCSA